MNDSGESRTMLSFSSSFDKTDAMFLEFTKDLNNPAGGSLLVGDHSNLELYIHANEWIPMSIAPGTEKPISSHVVFLSQAIEVCVQKTFSVHCLRWTNIGREYIEVVKGDLQRLFMLDFNDQTMNRFIEHQMLNTVKEFRGDYHRHFKKYSDSEEARVNPPHILHELAEQIGKSVDHVELFWQTHVRDGIFMSHTKEDVHNQILKLQSQPILEGSQPLSEDEISKTY
ncbi:CACTA en-spm transposon protein [Cucumis melo var. makuwa]|uniref:CACTA en-spm transposon protein n=1 Tax=Cucumis melo var. makuwa TaxID=1194695 RepID=A0A5D3DT21_CUCMM|nr:CACTA en-spm transposon protein [Cucumis melo var. makuwa]